MQTTFLIYKAILSLWSSYNKICDIFMFTFKGAQLCVLFFAYATF